MISELGVLAHWNAAPITYASPGHLCFKNLKVQLVFLLFLSTVICVYICFFLYLLKLKQAHKQAISP